MLEITISGGLYDIRSFRVGEGVQKIVAMDLASLVNLEVFEAVHNRIGDATRSER